MAEVIVENFKIIHINVNSIIRLSRRHELCNFLDINKPDFVLLNETKLNAKHKINFQNYETIRRDRPNSVRGGGVAILVRKGIKHREYRIQSINNFKYLETCIVSIPMRSNKTLFLVSAYYPSGSNDQFFKSEIQQLFFSLNLGNMNNYYVLAGDLNSKHSDWGNVAFNTKGNILKDWVSNNDINFKCKLYASTLPSFPRSNSFIDLCIADSRLNIMRENTSTNCLRTIEYDSDHNALEIIATADESDQPFSFFENITSPRYNFRKTNWKKFQDNISRALDDFEPIHNDRNLTNSEIDKYLQGLESIITNCIDRSVPKWGNTNPITQFVNPVIRKLQQEKSRILSLIKKSNRLQISLTSSELNILKVKLKLVRKLINDNFTLEVNRHYERKLSKFSSGNSENMFREIRKQFRMSSLNIGTLKIPQNEESLLRDADVNVNNLELVEGEYKVEDQDQILNVIGSYLEKVHSFKEIDPNNSLQIAVNDCFSDFVQTKFDYEAGHRTITIFSGNKKANKLDDIEAGEFFVTLDKLIYIFSNLNKKLSFGIDKIPNIILKHIPVELIREYCTIFNNIINNSYFPSAWKTAKTVVIPKKDKNPSILKNLRPISLLPNISKVFESCINNNLLKFCKNQNLINERQFGFKYRHSTTHAIHLLVSNIHWNWNRALCTGACLIDFEKAFDNVWIPGLIYKLEKYRMPLHFRILIYNMFNLKSFMVNNNGKSSSKTFSIVNGLQQGMVNSPILFNLYLHDLLCEMDNIIAFADDLIIYHADNTVSGINDNLQRYFRSVEKYASDWKLKINVDKCETILFRPPVNKCNYNVRKNWRSFGIKSHLNIDIPNREIVKYLGVNLDKFLYFNNHIHIQLEKAKRAFFMYKRLFYSKYIFPRVKIILYQTLIRPILTYGCPIWFNISPSYMEKYRLFERKCIRACLAMYRSPNSNYTKYISNLRLYNAAKINRIDNFIIHLIRNHALKSVECDENNLILASYYCSEDYIASCLISGYIPPEAFIYLDKKRYIQDNRGTPILYHIYRRANIKNIYDNQLTVENSRFDKAIFPRDRNTPPNVNMNKFWWLSV